jgi:phosphate transport system substrate-binding protein
LQKKLIASLAGLAVLALSLAAAAGAGKRDTSLTGAGSTFVAPLVQSWTPAVGSAYGIGITYGPIGSGGGINAIINRTVDFGASDAPMTGDQFTACRGCVQIPWALSATALMYRADGVPNHLKLTGKVIAAIFMGDVKRWNDPQIKRLNKGVKLPSTEIVPVHRSDNSGTTYNFTEYLSSVSKEWKSNVGKGVAVSWKGGIAGRGSSGVAAQVANTNGAIGYADIAYALKNHFKFAAVQNRAGKFQIPGIKAISEAAATIVRVAPNNSGISIVNPAKSHPLAYPICTFTYVIVPKQTSKAKELRTFVHWALTSGQKPSYTSKLLFAPLPKVVYRAALKGLAQVKS